MALVVACGPVDIDNRRANAGHADSAYRAALVIYERDSSTLDSLTRLVHTDSLYRLYRAALEPNKASVELVQRVSCEELHLSIRYGVVPAERAMKRMRDTVYRDQGIAGDGFRYFASLVPDFGQIDSQKCRPVPPTAPDVINGTRTDQEPIRPTRPRR